MNQIPPQALRKNVLLPRYPVCLIHGLKNIFHFHNYWHGIPEYLKAHGIDVIELKTYWRGPQKKRVEDLKNQLQKLSLQHPKLHIMAHSLGTSDSLVLADDESVTSYIASLTLISPLTGGTPWANLGAPLMPWLKDVATPEAAQNLLHHFKNKSGIFISAILANPQHPATAKVKLQKTLLAGLLKLKGQPTLNDGLIPLHAQKTIEKIANHVMEFPGDHMQVVGAGPWPGQIKTAHEVFLEHCIFLAEKDLQNAK